MLVVCLKPRHLLFCPALVACLPRCSHQAVARSWQLRKFAPASLWAAARRGAGGGSGGGQSQTDVATAAMCVLVSSLCVSRLVGTCAARRCGRSASLDLVSMHTCF
eukprot:363958-Chlamydomonas_euryale.AAC.7